MRRFLLPALVLSLAIAACSFALPRQANLPSAPSPTDAQIQYHAQPPRAAAPTADLAPTPTLTALPKEAASQPAEITGDFNFTNDIILTYYSEDAVSMTDLYGFVKRDKDWQIPVSSQSIGYLKINREKKTGIFDLQLPVQPGGVQVSVNPNGKDEKGVQIFALNFAPNIAGGPYAEGDDPTYGWPDFLASVKIDSENHDEVTGGKLVIWSPDGQQFFPSGFGADGLLFTQDDPVMPVPQGYSVIDLDQRPFKIIRDARPTMTLYEPKSAAIKDFSNLSYKDAFDQTFALVRKEYAFNGIASKQPDWDALYAELSPRAEQASQAKNAAAFYQVMHDFILAFHDGHVELNGGKAGQQVMNQQYGGGYGFAMRQMDDGRVVVVDVVQNGPAQKAGMKVGAIVSQFNGKPIDEAIAGVAPPASYSEETTLRYEQTRYLVRAPLGSQASVTFTDPGSSASQTARLTTSQEQESMYVTSPYRNYDPNALPVESGYISGSIGILRVNSDYDDLNLIVRLFQRGLEKFKSNGVTTLIIDMRSNTGGATLGLAGFLTDKVILLGQPQYYSETTGKFETEGPAIKFMPNEEQYHFDKMYLLVGRGCASACELESYGFSQVPGMVVVGSSPTSGTEAEVSRGQFKLPEGMSMQIPTGRYVLPDGSLFLEGQGVRPTVRVPINQNTLLNSPDAILDQALQLAQP